VNRHSSLVRAPSPPEPAADICAAAVPPDAQEGEARDAQEAQAGDADHVETQPEPSN
jgi:hypothetical protein